MQQQMETRFIRAMARRGGAQGVFRERVFAVTVPVTGSYHAMAEAAIADINSQGYEVQYIMDHSTKRECV
jgi:hypothetical protein